MFELRGRELYVWLPGGTGRSPLMQELGRDFGAVFNQMLAVVQHQQGLLSLQVRSKGLQGGLADV